MHIVGIGVFHVFAAFRVKSQPRVNGYMVRLGCRDKLWHWLSDAISICHR